MYLKDSSTSFGDDCNVWGDLKSLFLFKLLKWVVCMFPFCSIVSASWAGWRVFFEHSDSSCRTHVHVVVFLLAHVCILLFLPVFFSCVDMNHLLFPSESVTWQTADFSSTCCGTAVRGELEPVARGNGALRKCARSSSVWNAEYWLSHVLLSGPLCVFYCVKALHGNYGNSFKTTAEAFAKDSVLGGFSLNIWYWVFFLC